MMGSRWRRAILPAGVFLAVASVHYSYLVICPERDATQNRWVSAVSELPAFRRYLETQSYWLGLSYGVSLAFPAVAFRRYRERRMCSARNLAIGGISLSGVLAVVGCYLLGCCGSPMLPVYLSLFGVAFLPFTKPLVAVLTILMVLVAWWWMRRAEKRAETRAVGRSLCKLSD